MTVRLHLHCIDKELMVFEGAPADCPPIPQIGVEIECEGKMYRLEGVRYTYTDSGVDIHLLA